MAEKYNRLKQVLREQGRSGKWLAEKMGVNQYSVSRWSQNYQQPSLKTLYEIARILQVEVNDLLLPVGQVYDEGGKEEKGE